MLKPKCQIFNLKFYLVKVQAINNKVNSKIHAYLHIGIQSFIKDNQQLQFKGSPKLKKNIANFASDLEYNNFVINYDETTKLYEPKSVFLLFNSKALVVIQLQTFGTYIKIGEVNINLGQILNEKKCRVANVYPLAKCYDKQGKVKLSVDIIPISCDKRQNVNHENGQRSLNQSNLKQQGTALKKFQTINDNLVVSNGFYKNPTGAIKSRLTEQQNAILQQKVYDYEKKMDSYRTAQNELSSRMQEQLERKDEKFSELSLEFSKHQSALHLITLENQSQKMQINQLNQELYAQRLERKSHLQNIQNLQKELVTKEKQLQSKLVSLENLTRTKQNKQKHLVQQIQKYTAKYSQSEQQRNKIVFELQNKFKQQLQKKDHQYQEIIDSNEAKFFENIKTIKQRSKYFEEQYKEMEELAQKQENKIKAASLQLQKFQTLSKQQKEQMQYLNQQINKTKKEKETLGYELDSINFSYQETSNELQNHKEQIKQLYKKIQILKTELFLSNQTVQDQTEKIIMMNKELQVHEERQFYMKQHYENKMYDQELTENTLKEHKGSLQMQVKKLKQQLKFAQQRADELNQQNKTLKFTIQSLEKQLLIKNSNLLKIGEEKIHLETECKNAKELISQLQHQLIRLEQQKAYLSEALMQQKIVLENDKSFQWTYKVQSLQNNIQQMMDKFKHEKQSMKQIILKQEQKKIDEINKLKITNKKLKEQIDSFQQKLAKQQSEFIPIEKSLKSERQKSLDIEKQLTSLKQAYRFIINQKENLEQTIKELSGQQLSTQKQLNQTDKRLQKFKREHSQIKNAFNKLISHILEYIVKRYNQKANFQDISLDILVDTDFVSYVNVALKKFCDDHNKTRELIKQLQGYKKLAFSSNIKFNGYLEFESQNLDSCLQNEQFQPRYEQKNVGEHQQSSANSHFNKRFSQQKRILNYDSTSSIQPLQSVFVANPIKQLQVCRQQIDRLKMQHAQYKVKIKSLEEEIQKHERTIDNQRFDFKKVQSDLEQAQEQITKTNFILRKKDKIIKELEMQVQELQRQIFDLKNMQATSEKPKEKFAMTFPKSIESDSLSFFKELEAKFNAKSQQLILTQKQLQSLREQYLEELKKVKKLEAKFKEKSACVLNLEKQIDAQNTRKTEEKGKQMILTKKIEKQVEQRRNVENKVQQLQTLIAQYEIKIANLQSKNKQLHDQIKSAEIQFKKRLQSNQCLLSDKQNLYQTEILQLKNLISQQAHRFSELSQKNSHLHLVFTKKTLQFQTLKKQLAQKQQQLIAIEESFSEQKNKMLLEINVLNDKVGQLQNVVQSKQFELQECKFLHQNRVLKLERQVDELRDNLVKIAPNSLR